jgi:hypothetical protein
VGSRLTRSGPLLRKEEMPFLAGSRRLAVRAVKGACFSRSSERSGDP